MRIGVGTKNPSKRETVAETCKNYPLLSHAEIVSIPVNVEAFGHPIGLDATIRGAIDRAKQAFQECDYGIGIEGGLIEVPYTKTGYMEIGACAIWDGKKVSIGISPAFEWPTTVLRSILNEGLDASTALKHHGFTKEEKIGMTTGGVGIMTNGRVERKQYNALALMMALSHLEHPEFWTL